MGNSVYEKIKGILATRVASTKYFSRAFFNTFEKATRAVWKASEDGKSGVYIPEEEYTDEIRDEMQRAGNRNRATVRMSSLKI